MADAHTKARHSPPATCSGLPQWVRSCEQIGVGVGIGIGIVPGWTTQTSTTTALGCFYLFGAGCMVLCYGVLLWRRAPAVLVAGFSAALLAMALATLANRYWTKVSVHTGVAAGLAAAAACYSLPLALLLGALAVGVTWARLVTGRHTLTQALAAWAIALVCAKVVFRPWV